MGQSVVKRKENDNELGSAFTVKLILFSSTMLSLHVRGNFRSDQQVEISEHVVGNDRTPAARPSAGVTFLCAHGGGGLNFISV